MNFIVDHILQIFLLVIFGFIIYDKRHYLKEKLAEKRIIIWMISISIFFIIVLIFTDKTEYSEKLHDPENIYDSNNFLFYSCAIGSICWFLLKLICRAKGYKVSYFVDHFRDIKNSIKIIKHDENTSIRYFTLFTLVIMSLSFLVLAFSIYNEILSGYVSV